MAEIKDLVGLSEPIKRLIEVVADGIGGISHPLLTKKNADAKAYEIRTITHAIADSQKLLSPVKYENGNVTIDISEQILDAAIDQRVISRIAYQEAKMQANIEQVTRYAAEQLSNEQSVDPGRPEVDWITRFFRIAEDITSEQMQILWGKVLAGEVKRPSSYSLRTLDLLKNISTKEAELFAKIGQFSFFESRKAFIPNPDSGKYLKDKFDLKFLDFLLLREIDLLVESDLEFSLQPSDQAVQTVFTCGLTCVSINRSPNTPKQAIPAIVFTEIGRELLQLLGEKTC